MTNCLLTDSFIILVSYTRLFVYPNRTDGKKGKQGCISGAENLLFYMRYAIAGQLLVGTLTRLNLFETNDSFAERLNFAMGPAQDVIKWRK